MEVRRVAGAAIEANCPKVVRLQRQLRACRRRADRDRRHAVGVQILEAHRSPEVYRAVVREDNAPAVHQLLPAHPGRIDLGVLIEVCVVVVLLHVRPEVEVSQDHREEPRNQGGDHQERQPTRRLRGGLAAPICGLPAPEPCRHDQVPATQQHEKQCQTGQCPTKTRRCVVHLERHQGVDAAEEEPRQEETLKNRYDVQSLPLAPREEWGRRLHRGRGAVVIDLAARLLSPSLEAAEASVEPRPAEARTLLDVHEYDFDGRERVL
mmetsp:Transcript_15205/g.53401  ORF Transcript_15205/g.53401 Transcript_15205/m.53401 type:complete len:265 (+) Transcript_15205:396-1190(+)